MSFAASGNISRIVDSIVFFYFECNSRKDPFPFVHDAYLRTYRKQSGLTRQEVALLLRCENGAQVSRYEKRHRLPPLETALACEAIFGIPVSELFAGLRQSVAKDMRVGRQTVRDLFSHEERRTHFSSRLLCGTMIQN